MIRNCLCQANRLWYGIIINIRIDKSVLIPFDFDDFHICLETLFVKGGISLYV